MRRLSALAIAVAVGGSMLMSAPANAVGVTTCIVAAGVSAGPGGVEVDYLYVGSVSDCV